MSIKIEPNYSAFIFVSSVHDEEWQRIINKLWGKYGIRSTGSKTLDKAKLHELELKEAKAINGENKIDFITISKSELDKIKTKIKEDEKNKNPKEYAERHGEQLLGEQIYMAIQMKKEEEKIENKRKRENKYQT